MGQYSSIIFKKIVQPVVVDVKDKIEKKEKEKEKTPIHKTNNGNLPSYTTEPEPLFFYR